MSKKFRFVVQKHNSHKGHFDLRLEFRGILKSWAIPDGLSPFMEDNRLAIETKDHPINFLEYEDNTVANGRGEKKMEIWDSGVYYPSENKRQISEEEILEKGFKKGKVTLTIEGQKLNGYYELVKTSFRSNDHWLISKKRKKNGK